MNRYDHKLMQFTPGLERNQPAHHHDAGPARAVDAAVRPDAAGGLEPKPNQMVVLDPADPITYESICDWPAPLPLDLLVKLNEVQAKMGLGLESKKGALKDLGEAMPDKKLQEVFEELLEDNLRQGAIDLQKMEIAIAQQVQTGMAIDPETGQPAMILTRT